MKKTLTEYLDNGFIRISNSLTAAPVFFVKKPRGSLRFYIDYRNFNRITKKIIFSPLIYDFFQNIGGTKWYIELDVKTGFSQNKNNRKGRIDDSI